MATLPYWEIPSNLSALIKTDEDLTWESDRWSPIQLSVIGGTSYSDRDIDQSWQIEFEPVGCDGYELLDRVLAAVDKSDPEIRPDLHCDDTEKAALVIWTESEDVCRRLMSIVWPIVQPTERMVTIPKTLRRFYIVTNSVAVALALVAAVINAFVGPTNLILWLVPGSMLMFAAVVLMLIVLTVRQANCSDAPRILRWLFGDRVARIFHRIDAVNIRIVMHFFLVTVPVFFSLIAVSLVYASVTGQINSAG